jgi:competence protein ComEA
VAPTYESPSVDGDAALRRPPPPRSWRERLEQAADATGTTPARILIGGAAGAAALVAGVWLTRPPAAPAEVALPFASTTAAASPTTEPAIADQVVVHVAGAVQQPGVHELAAGARVTDAIAAAGGLTADADGARLNLAARVADGERVYVLALGEDAPPPVAGSSPAAGPNGAGAAATPVDLNAADESTLDALPGVGPATAAAIVEHRSKIGRFTSVDQLLDVRGIGEAKLDALRDLVRV